MGNLKYDSGHGRYKGLLFNYDFVKGESEDRCLFCLTKQQVAYLLSSLEPARWKTRWYSPTDADIDTDWLDAVFSKLEAELMTDHCDLDSTLTTIQNSLTTINNNLTIVENNITNIDIEVKNIITQNTNINIVNVINNFVTFATTTDDNTATETYARYNALCAGINDWVYSQCYRVAAAAGVSAFGLDLIVAGLTVGVNALEGLVHTDNPGAYSATDLQNAFTSATDMEAVACWIIQYLALLPMSFDSFKSSLSAFTPANAYQTTIAVTLQAALIYYDAYTAFVMNQQSEFQIALAAHPTGFSCLTCSALSFCSIPQTWDFVARNSLPWIIERGVIDGINGVKAVQIAGDLQFGYDVSIEFSPPCTALATHHIHFFTAQQSPGGNAYTIEYYYLLAGVLTRYNQSNSASVSVWPAVDDLASVIPAPPGGVGVGIAKIRWYTNTAYYGNATSHPSAAAKLTKITFAV